MSLLVTGSIGIDTVETPYGRQEEVIGGSAVYFAYAASFFHPVRLVGVVGDDCPGAFFRIFEGRPIDASGLETRRGSKTFRWHGSYVRDLNSAETLRVDLNVLSEKAPTIPQGFLDSEHVFLANTHPALQQEMLASLRRPKLAVADTMNLWIANEKPELLKLLRRIDGLVLNDGEARMLTGESNLPAAARAVMGLGPRFVVIKKGEHGSLACMGDETMLLPAYPAERVVDPTGAGDSFAGGMMGALASAGAYDAASLRRAIAVGTVVASFTIADFSLAGLRLATADSIAARLERLRRMAAF